MNYQPLFELMSQYGLTLLEGEMEEIIRAVNEGQGTVSTIGTVHQEPSPKKLTYLEFERLANISPSYPDIYDAIFHYLADEQPEQFTALGSTTLNPPTKPDPSRLEVAAMIYASNWHIGASLALIHADELIKHAKA